MTAALALGRLEKIELRKAWANEAGSFTPWLAQAENIELLSEAIGVELEVEAQEKFVGPFRADILCKDVLSNRWVLIENQLERTDHGHLGQLLTYAAGLKAVTIVWIAQRFTDEHRAALDWLNEITNEDFNFFGLEVELWRIGESAAAPKFNVVSKPNDWTRTISEAAHRLDDGELSETRRLQLEYWMSLRDVIAALAPDIRLRKPAAGAWFPISLGRFDYWMEAFVNTRDERIGVQLVCNAKDDKTFFRRLERQRREIESEIGVPLQWEEMPEKRRSLVALRREDMNPLLRDDWPKQHEWLAETMVSFYRTFQPRVRSATALGSIDQGDVDGRA